MNLRRTERAYEKHAWIIFFVFPIFFIIESLRGLLFIVPQDELILERTTGMTWGELVASSPGVANYIGLASIATYYVQGFFAVLIMVISLKSYRRGDKWAWYTFWILPAFSLLTAGTRYLRYGETGTAQFVIPFLVIILLGLLLPIRKFFPRGPPMTSRTGGA